MDKNIEDMTDEELEAMPIPDFTELVTENDTIEEEDDGDDDESEEIDTENTEATNEDTDSDLSAEDDKEILEEEPIEETEPSTEEVKDDSTDTEIDPNEVVKEDTKEPSINYEEEYKKLLSPFKADGRNITPKSPEDLIRLAQMGVNYHNKMSGIKPARKTLKKLENNGLLDDEKIDLLIDAYKGNIDAITKLIKKHNIDPLDVDINKEDTYKPSDYSVSDAEIELDSVLEAIQESPNYDKTVEVVTTKWDDKSREHAAANPHIISTINEHMDSGVYDKVMDEVHYQRSLGNLRGMSDIEAYGLMGDKLEKAGAFNQDTTEQVSVKKPPTSKSNLIQEKARKAKKKAASPTKQSKSTSKLPKDFNPLDLSDEEFKKFDPALIGIK